MSRQSEKTLARRGALLLVARIFPALALLLVMVWYSRTLPTEVYGQYQNVWVRYGLLSTLACLGIPTIAQIIGPAEMILGLRNTSPKLRMLFGVLLIVLAFLFGFWNRHYLPVSLSAVFFTGWVAATIAEGLALGQRRYRLVSVVNLLGAVLFLLLHFFFLNSTKALFGSLTLVALLRALMFFQPLFRAWRLSGKDDTLGLPTDIRRLWRDLAAYDLVQQSSRLLDKGLVGFLVVPALSAVYFNGAQEVPFLPLLLGAAGSAFLHQAAETDKGDMGGKAFLIRTTSNWLATFVFPLFWFLMFCRAELFDFAFGGKYAASVPIFAMTTLVLPLRAYPFSAMLQHCRQSHWVLWGAAGDLVLATILSFVFYPFLGLPGIALAFTVSTLLMVLFYTWKTVQVTGLSLADLFPLPQWGLKFLSSAIVLFSIRKVLFSAGVSGQTALFLQAFSAAGLALFWAFRNFRKTKAA